MSGFSDRPIEMPNEAFLYHDTFEAKYVSKSLEDYTCNHTYDGTTLHERCKFSRKVEGINPLEDASLVELSFTCITYSRCSISTSTEAYFGRALSHVLSNIILEYIVPEARRAISLVGSSN